MAYAAYKCYSPKFVENEMKYFFISSGIFPILIGIDWNNIIPKSETNNSKILMAIGLVYGSFGFYPQKLKYMIAIMAFLKLQVTAGWIKKGCKTDEPNNAGMTIAVGDAAYAILFLLAFYQIYKS